MAVKNWLIRTKNKQILGPATKEKVIELIEKGSLSGEDEITRGNGYWFWVREQDLLEKYLYGDIPQSFNPISEAQDVLTSKSTPDGVTASIEESPQRAKQKADSPAVTILPEGDELAYPDDDDLAYPDMGELDYPDEVNEQIETTSEIPDPCATGEIDLKEAPLEVATSEPVQLKEEPKELEEAKEDQDGEENFIYPSAQDLEYPEDIHGHSTPQEVAADAAPDEDRTDPNVMIPNIEEDPDIFEENEEIQEEEIEEEEPVRAPPKKSGKKKAKKKKRKRVVEEKKGSDRYLFVIAFLILVIISLAIYYYKKVLNKPLPVIGMASAHAQTIKSLSKKKA